MENNTNQLNSMMCKKNCGFFGNAACDGYCSKCYKDHVKRQNSGSANGRVTPTTGLTNSNSSSSSVISSSIQSQNINSDIPTNQLSSIGEQMMSITATSLENETLSNSKRANSFSNNTSSSSPSSTSSSSNSTTTSSSSSSSTPILNTQMSNSSASMPIPIPSRSQSINKNEGASAIDIGMSVPSDLLATSPSTATSVDESGTSMGTSIGSEKKKRSRCVLESCKRKVGLTGFDCRCGGLYCWEHRYSDKHNCKFDYKELGQDQIRKNNPIVVGEKIQKI